MMNSSRLIVIAYRSFKMLKVYLSQLLEVKTFLRMLYFSEGSIHNLSRQCGNI